MENRDDKYFQSYLEKGGIEERKQELARNDFGVTGKKGHEYGPDDAKMENGGKGSNVQAPKTWVVPDPSKGRNQMSDPMYNTDIAGDECDRVSREKMMSRSLYGPGRAYGIDYVVDTSLNRQEGQYDIAAKINFPWSCPSI